MRYRGYIERIVSDEGTEGKRALGRFRTPEERTPLIVTTSKVSTRALMSPPAKTLSWLVPSARPAEIIYFFRISQLFLNLILTRYFFLCLCIPAILQ